MLMPYGTEMRNNYMVEGSMNLPWLDHRKHDSEIAEAISQGQRTGCGTGSHAQAGIRRRSRRRWPGKSRARNWRMSIRVPYGPQAEATLRSTVIAYENDQTDFLNLLDSQSAVIDIDLAYSRRLRTSKRGSPTWSLRWRAVELDRADRHAGGGAMKRTYL